MGAKNYVKRRTIQLLLGQVLCMALVEGIFALLQAYETKVLLGAIVGVLLAVGNFFAMAYAADLAADKAQAQDVAGGQKIVSLSYILRMAVLIGALLLCAFTGWFHIVTLVIPLALSRPILTVIEAFSKKGGSEA